MSIKISLEEALQRLHDKHGTIIIMTNYYAINNHADFRCEVCGYEWKAKPASVIRHEVGCFNCAHKKIGRNCSYTEVEVREKIFSTHGDKITMLSYAGDAAVGKSEFKCNVCGNIWKTNAKGIYRGNGCWKCGVISRGIKHRGSNSNWWKGGMTKLRPFIKGGLTKWQEDSMKFYNYKCIFTGSKDFHIHHLYPLNNIVEDALLELGLEQFDFISEYSEENLSPIVDKVMEIHYRYPLGVCIRKDIHKVFHKTYGKTNCTPEDFYEFAEKIKSGEIKI